MAICTDIYKKVINFQNVQFIYFISITSQILLCDLGSEQKIAILYLKRLYNIYKKCYFAPNALLPFLETLIIDS
jgi:hypothetical protein